MVGPIRVEGLFSGIDFASIVKQLAGVERRPIETLQKRIQTDTSRKTALLDLSARLLSLRSSAQALSLPGFFNRTRVTSGNEAAIRASGDHVGSVGAFTFQARKLAQAHHLLSNGFADSNTTRIGPATVTFEFGDGAIDRQTPVRQLNGGRGIDPGFVRVTDNAGRTALVDLEGAVTLRDVLDAFNNNTQIQVSAAIEADRLVLRDRTGLAGTGLRVDDVGLDTTAGDLGLAGRTAVDVGGATPDVRLFGGAVNVLAATTPLSQLNDGLGVRSVTGDDFAIQPKAGAAFNVDVPSTAKTVQDLLDAVNGSAGNGGRVVASLNAEGTGLQLLDVSGGGGSLSVAPIGASRALLDFGWSGVSVLDETTGQPDPAGTLLSGRRLLASLDGVLTRTLNGGVPAAAASDGFAGTRDGTIRLQNRAGSPAVDVNLSGRSIFAFDSVVAGPQPTIRVATPAGTPVSFAVGNRITLTGTDGGAGRTVVRTLTAVASGPPGFTDLSFDEALPATLALAPGNAVASVAEGTADVLRLLNAAGSAVGISARVKDEGNGFLLTDASGGAGELQVEDLRTSLAAGAAFGDGVVTVASAAGFRVGQTLRLSGGGASETKVITSIAGATLGLDTPIAAAGGYAAGAEASGVAATDFGILNAGRAESGTATSFTDNALIGYADDFFVGAAVRVLSGPNAGTVRTVSDFNGTTGTVTLNGSALATPFDDTTVYRLSVAPDRVRGRDVDPQYIGENTLLKSLNAGAGVAAGRFQITDRQGRQVIVDLRQADDTTVGKALTDINNAASAAGSALTARINDTGDGILLFDATPTGSALRVEELDNGRTARGLNLLGTAPGTTPQTLDGSFEFRVALAAPSTLDEIVSAVNARGLAVTAAVLNDGSPAAPYRLSLLSSRSGTAGRMVVEASEGLNGVLGFTTTSRAEDAVLLFGTDSGANDPALVISPTNTLSGVVPGLTLELRSATSSPVTVSVSRDTEGAVDQVQRLADAFNGIRSKIDELTDLNEATQQRGLLFGDAAVHTLERQLTDMFLRPVTGIATSRLNTLGQVGLEFDTAGRLSLDASKLQGMLETRFEEVRDLFSLQAKLTTGTPVADLNGGLGLGVIEGDDFRIFQRDGTAITVDLVGANKAGDILSAINVNPDNTGDLSAAFSPSGFGFTLSDASAAAAFAADPGTSGATLVAPAGSPFDGKPDNYFRGMTLRRSDTGLTALVTGFVGATRTLTLSGAIFSGAGDPFAVDVQVVSLNGSRAANDLGLSKVSSPGSSVLEGDLRSVANSPGVGPRLNRALGFLTDAPSGLIPARTGALDEEVKQFRADIQRIEDRARRLEVRLVKRFSKLEQFIAFSQGTINQLQGSFAGLAARGTGAGGRGA